MQNYGFEVNYNLGRKLKMFGSWIYLLTRNCANFSATIYTQNNNALRPHAIIVSSLHNSSNGHYNCCVCNFVAHSQGKEAKCSLSDRLMQFTSDNKFRRNKRTKRLFIEVFTNCKYMAWWHCRKPITYSPERIRGFQNWSGRIEI